MKKLIIVRGLPSSGKSFLSKQLYQTAKGFGKSCAILSTDEFFIIGGRYKWSGKFIGVAHNWNYARCCKAIFDKTDYIIIDNTNLQFKEFEKYIGIAIENGYSIEIVESNTPWKHDIEELTKRNTHGVPKETIQKMLDRMESMDIIKEKLDNFIKEKQCQK